MLHVKQIKDIVDAGQTDEAHEALDQLLALGPSNTEALKLKARLFGYEGRFLLEHRTWDKIASIDPEDEDAIAHMWGRQVEEREHFYFTDDLPGGGRRFMAYPRRLVFMSIVGLFGCVGFLLIMRMANLFPILGEPPAMLTLFAVLVLGPWFGIIGSYFLSLRAVVITPDGIAVATRRKVHAFTWTDLDKVCLARAIDAHGASLSLVLVPRESQSAIIEIDMAEGSSTIRARSYLLRDISRLFREPEYTRRDSLGLGSRKITAF